MQCRKLMAAQFAAFGKPYVLLSSISDETWVYDVMVRMHLNLQKIIVVEQFSV